jgi:predicted DNA-binding transcriptional regulator AlpA
MALSAKERAKLEIPKKLYSVVETSVALGISSRLIYNQVSQKTFPIKPLRIGRGIRFRVADIDSYVNGLGKEV